MLSEKKERLVYSVPETADQLGVSVSAVYDLVHRADFPSIKIGCRIVVSRKGLQDWLQKQVDERMGVGI